MPRSTMVMHATSRSESQPAGHDGAARGRTRGVHGEELLHVHQDARGQVLVDHCVRAHPGTKKERFSVFTKSCRTFSGS
jgi:hypothetical protein